MNDLERVAVVIALVGAFRARNAAGHLYAPFLEGNAVTLVAALVGGALCAIGSPSPPWHALARGVVLGTVAAGVMTALKYAGDHVGTALGRALAATRPRLEQTTGNEGKAIKLRATCARQGAESCASRPRAVSPCRGR